MKWNQDAIDFLQKCHPTPPEQGKVGRPPLDYLPTLHYCLQTIAHSSEPIMCDGSPTDDLITRSEARGKCSRKEIREICTASEVDVLEAYAAAMAWGGQRSRWFKSSIISADRLRKLLCHLKSSTGPRLEDFVQTQKEAESITGLGISFYTKLLFFFGQAGNAYILDQWTTRSMTVLDLKPTVRLAPWGGPASDTSGEEYESYCRSIEQLANDLGGWTPEQAEMAIFDSPSGEWRKWVKRHGSGVSQIKRTRSSRDSTVKKSVSTSGSESETLADSITDSHIQANECGVSLPPGLPTENHQDGSCVLISSKGNNGIQWQYWIRRKHVRCQVYFPHSRVSTYHALNQAAGGLNEFSSKAPINPGMGDCFGHPPAPGRVGRTANIHQLCHLWDDDHEGTAEAAVETMSDLWMRVHSLADQNGIEL